MMFGKITIFTSGNRAEIKRIDKSQVRLFAEGVRDKISGGQSKPVADKPAVDSEDDALAQLERLGALKKKGVITKKEFDEKKKQLLDL